MQVTEALIIETSVSKFMPELVSAEELLMLADSYQARIETAAATLHQHDKGSEQHDKGSEQHRVLSEELNGMMRRRRFLVKTARYRLKLEREFAPAQPKGHSAKG
jgi:hypothetical protein